jgi:ribosomal protein L30
MMKRSNFIDQEIIVTQIKSSNKLRSKQKLSLRGLGLKKIGSSIRIKCSSEIFGMIQKVEHLLKLSKVN